MNKKIKYGSKNTIIKINQFKNHQKMPICKVLRKMMKYAKLLLIHVIPIFNHIFLN